MRFGDVSNKSPIDKFLQWEGHINNGYFSFYNKETGKKEKYDLTDFIIIKTWYTIKWYNDKKWKGAFSNEIESFKEDFIVRFFDNEKIAEGQYRDIKDKLPDGIKLHLAITVFTNGELVEFFLKGIAFFEFSELLKTINIFKNKVVFKWIKKDKKWATEFTLPVWEMWADITKDERKQAKELDTKLKTYDQQKFTRPEKNDKQELVKDEEFIDDVPF